ncbi:FAD-dependent monooxygenase [Fluoribacter dumoffii]|uniref:FAD-dependent monooxygenase n=1 Tax=Fluoribacter dumoffii TaxID=463 RepID=UPI00026C7B47|nr:FAD-dependent monooxygenase [Fluoribacter dumoffii]MCW8416723.1 FAD-dependent monooxygenase [Fluoribacter dumoffii]MCW8455437.1 FAD-dependent monooxygenase [Fluoribacter dumoffii]MCW8460485.1 FAD-dependent monooxygenase [Fluoribacter dumoffii]MCW8483966.1 FAD-dependent monooxygenase [Fluoribacter dumoffii]
MADKIWDVLVVGAGPVGLFCANELKRHGLNCRIIDKKSTLSDKSKALAIHIRTLDLLKDGGFLEQILIEGQKVNGVLFQSEGKELIHATYALVEADYHFVIDLPQNRTEHIFQQALLDRGLHVEWQTELMDMEQTPTHIISTVKHIDGESEKIQSHWIIACDGSHSTMRKLVHAEFIGSSFKQTWWLADLLIDWELPEDKFILFVSDKGPAACFPMGEKRYRVVMTAPEKIMHQEPTLEDITHAFKVRCSEPANLHDPVWISQFGIDHKQIQNYRYGRVFFAGDSAHVHSPMGGQGLNTGLQDIYNLVWKLALVQKGLAKDALLDSYNSERHPIAAEVLKQTGNITRLIMMSNRVMIFLRNFILKMAMSFDSMKRFVLYNLAELTVSYAKSPIVKVLGEKTSFKIGEFLISFPLIEARTHEKRQLQQITQGTLHHLFLFAGLSQTNQMPLLIETARNLAQQFNGLIKTHIIVSHPDIALPDADISMFFDEQQTMHQRFKINQPIAVLIRPDKYIGLTQMPVNPEELQAYMRTAYFRLGGSLAS